MQCSSCGAEIAPGTRFCPSCGAAEPQAGFCGKCGTPLVPDDSFCRACGAPIAGVPSAAAPPTPPARQAVAPRRADPVGTLLTAVGSLLLLAAIAGGGYLFWNSDANPLARGTPSPTARPTATLVALAQPTPTTMPTTAAKPAAAASPTATAAPKPTAPPPKPTAPPATPTAKPTPTPTPQPTPIDLGVADMTVPELEKLVQTEEWGEVPANHVVIAMKEGQRRPDADRVAAELGGRVVGEIAYIGVYQLEVEAEDEQGLRANLERVRGTEGVASAFPLQQVYLRDGRTGQRCSPINDPAYAGDAGLLAKMVGMENAWKYVQASGIELSDVRVGVTDDGIYKGKVPDHARPGQRRVGRLAASEFGGPVKVSTLEPEDELDEPADIETGSHGSAVTRIIGANPDDGGATGIASVLGPKLSIQMTNVMGGKYANYVKTRRDPEDEEAPTVVDTKGKIWVLGPLAAMEKQIKDNAKVINMSWGVADSAPEAVAAYRQFFTRMAKEHPDVTFVAAAAYGGQPVDGDREFPSGAALPNVITVGALNSDGSTLKACSRTSPNYEITIAAPGAVVGARGRTPLVKEGTSFAAPQVTSAIALMKALNPNLKAERIKEILRTTADTQVTTSGQAVAVDPAVGGKVLRVDKAVLQVIREVRKEKGLQPVDIDEDYLRKLTVVDIAATSGKPLEWTIKATVETTGQGGVDLALEAEGKPSIKPEAKRHLDKQGEATWTITYADLKQQGKVKVTRLDTKGCATVVLDYPDLEGTWRGAWTTTDVEVASDIPIGDPFDSSKPPTIIKKEQCEAELMQARNETQSLTMDFKPDSPQAGAVVFTTQSVTQQTQPGGTTRTYSPEKSQPMPYKFDGTKMTIDAPQQGAVVRFEGTVAVAEREYTMTGPFSMVIEKDGKALLRIAGTFDVSKPREPKP